MRIEILSSGAGLVEEWWDLWRRDPDATVFQSPAWLLPWRRQFDEGETRILAIRSEGRLVGLLPLFHLEDRFLPWGAGTTDWLDGLFDPELPAEDLARGLAEIAAPIDLFQLRFNSRLLEAPLPGDWTERRGLSEACPEIPLPARLPSKMKRNLRYYGSRAVGAGVAEPERGGPELFEDLVELHGRRWRERDEPGVLSDPRVLAFHREALPLLEQAGLLRLYALRRDGRDGRAVAAIYVLGSKQKAFSYLIGFDPTLEMLGLGTILIGHAIAEAEREGDRTFDFLRGREAYKYLWGAADQPSHSRFLSP